MQRRRQAFTLVELLVSMALIIFIMAILSQAFAVATQTFRNLKSAGDMAEKLRAATGIMRRYLAADHFEGKRRLSDPNFWLNGPPSEGFFRVWHGSPYWHGSPTNDTSLENTEPDGSCPCYRSTTHALHFTVKLRGNLRSDYFSTTVPIGSPLPALPGDFGDPNNNSWFVWPAQPETRYQDSPPTAAKGTIYDWQWAEVAFFLRATGDNANGTPLYGLYMRQLLAVPDNGSGLVLPQQAAVIPPQTLASLQTQVPVSQQTLVPGYLEVSCQPDPSGQTANLYFNSPQDLTMPTRRFDMTPGNMAGVPSWKDPLTGQLTYPTYAEQATGPGNTTMFGADLLLTNVISFDVRLLTAQPPTNWDAFEDLFQLTNPNRLPKHYSLNSNNGAFSTSGPLVFDTWSNNRDDTYNYTNWTSSIPILNDNLNPPGQIIIRAVQVTLRIWDEKTQLTRQVTFVQAL